ncbi:MAG TPA: carotenoid biosynthesis protein [Vicinamibacteria bacterium]|nr:carotenoid biosynthesis protein [Vicinamibacteria bacterium]
MSTLPVEAFELVVAPAAGAVALAQAARALGLRRASLELLALVAYGYALERVAILVFASHEYGPAWRAAPGGVPLAVAVGWAAVILGSAAAAWRLGLCTPLALAAGAALVGVTLDLLIEPVAVRAGLWRWTPPGPWLGVPVGNFVGWAVIVGVYVYGAERAGDARSEVQRAAHRIGLGAVAILALVGVGLLWTRIGAERAFAGGRAAAVAGVTLLPLLALARREPPARAAAGLAARLGRAGRPWALGVVAIAFGAEAVLLRETALAAVAAGVIAVLVRTLAK